jgi:hypothetical protein
LFYFILFYFVLLYFVLFYFACADSRLWRTAAVLSSARQTGRLDHISFTMAGAKEFNLQETVAR